MHPAEITQIRHGDDSSCLEEVKISLKQKSVIKLRKYSAVPESKASIKLK